MEAINDSSKLVAQAIQILKDLNTLNINSLLEAINLLEEALEKLANKM